MEMDGPLQCPKTVTVRRNPHRKARPTPSTNVPQTASQMPQISAFPIQEILSIEIPKADTTSNSLPSLQPSNIPKDSLSENLKVYLRIRPPAPLKGSTKLAGDQNPRSRSRNVWPQNPAKKNLAKEKIPKRKSNENYIVVANDSLSVTLTPPSALQESKRIKSEVYEGFSHVFSENSTQAEVYERMVNPLVEDFLRDKSGMLAALGPTGSGKTHTVFGSPRDPGMVPLALKHIFRQTKACGSVSSRQFYLSIFEICVDRGKAERITDLSQDGIDLSMQQSTVRGLKEVVLQDAEQAELFIANAMLKRSTAMTNSNNQSSRSQCIINIRSVANKRDGKPNVQTNDAVLTIVDLAGAEREKRTGNQGARLLESNFINNTSMVFGLCLRSLLEHQKNPKKPLQKHFQNSMLTRYLRDYLEGKKRMALILTVKSGEEDYLDASYLLRQASPFMKIKFSAEEESNLLCNKRQLQTLSRVEQSKRMKIHDLDACVVEEKNVEDEHELSEKDDKDNTQLELNCDGLVTRERNHQIMQNFSKALWMVLKQYKQKLEVAEREVIMLRENLRIENERNLLMENEVNNLKCFLKCRKGNSTESNLDKVDNNFEPSTHLEEETSCVIVEENSRESNLDKADNNFERSTHLEEEASCVIVENSAESKLEKVDNNFEHNTHLEENTSCVIVEENSAESKVDKVDNNFEPITRLEEETSCVIFKENSAESNLDKVDHNFEPSTHLEEETSCVITEKGNSAEPNLEVDNSFEPSTHLEEETSCVIAEKGNSAEPNLEVDNSFEPSTHLEEETSCVIAEGNSAEPNLEVDNSFEPSTHQEEETSCVIAEENFAESNLDKVDNSFEHSTHLEEEPSCVIAETNVDLHSPNPVGGSKCNSTSGRCDSIEGEADILSKGNVNTHFSNCTSFECGSIPEKGDSLTNHNKDVCPQDKPVLSVSQKEYANTEFGTVSVPDNEAKLDTSCKPLNAEKPKRRLLPASSILLRDIDKLDMDDETEKPKGNRGGKKQVVDGRPRTQGSITLLRLLQSNLHL